MALAILHSMAAMSTNYPSPTPLLVMVISTVKYIGLPFVRLTSVALCLLLTKLEDIM